jgi:hypothetical protein
MRPFHIRCFIFLISLLTVCSASAQDTLLSFKTSGGFTGYGYELNPGIRYRVTYFAGDFSFPFGNKKKKNFLSWYLEPQLNLVSTGRTDIEFGTNIGLRYFIRIGKNSWFYPMIGSGPHFITAELERQATGFIFSDNFGLGIFKKIKSKNSILLNLQLRYRHISNASFKKPNSGIDNINLILGLSKMRL